MNRRYRSNTGRKPKRVHFTSYGTDPAVLETKRPRRPKPPLASAEISFGSNPNLPVATFTNFRRDLQSTAAIPPSCKWSLRSPRKVLRQEHQTPNRPYDENPKMSARQPSAEKVHWLATNAGRRSGAVMVSDLGALTVAIEMWSAHGAEKPLSGCGPPGMALSKCRIFDLKLVAQDRCVLIC
jgi:hypothetical protein